MNRSICSKWDAQLLFGTAESFARHGLIHWICTAGGLQLPSSRLSAKTSKHIHNLTSGKRRSPSLLSYCKNTDCRHYHHTLFTSWQKQTVLNISDCAEFVWSENFVRKNVPKMPRFPVITWKRCRRTTIWLLQQCITSAYLTWKGPDRQTSVPSWSTHSLHSSLKTLERAGADENQKQKNKR